MNSCFKIYFNYFIIQAQVIYSCRLLVAIQIVLQKSSTKGLPDEQL